MQSNLFRLSADIQICCPRSSGSPDVFSLVWAYLFGQSFSNSSQILL